MIYAKVNKMEQKQTQVEKTPVEVQQNSPRVNLKGAEQIKAKKLDSIMTKCD